MLQSTSIPVPALSLGGRSSSYASVEANIGVLDGVLAHLCVTKYQLADLLDIRPTSNVYAWASGRRRPSNLMMTRLVTLILWQAEGQPVFEMKSIDWNTMTITMREGARRQPSVNGVAGRQLRPGPGPGPGEGLRPAVQQAAYPYGGSGAVY
jgi:hypothetical protein